MKGLEKDCKTKINRKPLQQQLQVLERICEELFVSFLKLNSFFLNRFLSQTENLKVFFTFEVAIYGAEGAGKSGLVLQYCPQFTPEYDPTIEEYYTKKILVDGLRLNFSFCDTKVAEYRAMLHPQMEIMQGFILVYSITSKDSFRIVKETREDIARVKESQQFPMVLVACKCELEGDREVTKQEGVDLAEKWGCPFFETSARNCTNIEQAFQSIAKEVFKAHISHSQQDKGKRCEIF